MVLVVLVVLVMLVLVVMLMVMMVSTIAWTWSRKARNGVDAVDILRGRNGGRLGGDEGCEAQEKGKLHPAR